MGEGRIKISDAIQHPVGGGPANPIERQPRATTPEQRLRNNPYVIQPEEQRRQADEPAAPANPMEMRTGARETPTDETLQERKERLFKLKFRKEEIEVPESRMTQLAQIGMSAEKLESRRAEIERLAKENENKIATANVLERLAQTNPRAFQRIVDIAQGREPVQNSDDDDGDGLTQPQQTPSVVFDLQRRLEQLEAQNNQFSRSFQQRDIETRTEAALNADEYLRSNPEAGAAARRFLEAGLATGEYDSPEQGAIAVSAYIKRIVAGHLEVERKTREDRRETSAPRGTQGGPQFQRFDRSKATYEGNRKGGQSRAAFRDYAKNLLATLRGANPNV